MSLFDFSRGEHDNIFVRTKNRYKKSFFRTRVYKEKERERDVCLHLLSQVVDLYGNRMHRMTRQPPPPPPPQPSLTIAKPHPSRNSSRLLNESIKPK